MKFLFDLFPVILFFLAFKVWGIYVATAVTIAATCVQIAWTWFRHRRVEPMLWISFAIVVVFGGATLVLHNDTFIKWKPTALYWAFSIGLLIAHAMGKNPVEAMMGKQMTLPHLIWRKLNIIWAIFFAVMGVLNVIIAYQFSTDVWVNFKLFGGTVLMLIFVIGQSFWLNRYMQNE